MKMLSSSSLTHPPAQHGFPRLGLPRWVTSAALWVAVTALLLGGCATRRDVADIITRSNAALLTSQLGASVDLLTNATHGTVAPVNVMEAAAKIDAFIEAHPDQPATLAALRIRQGILYLTNKRLNLARAAFEAAPLEHLHTERDRAIKLAADPLIWWAQNSTLNPFPLAEIPRAESALRALDTQVTHLNSPSASAEGLQTRDLLAEIRAWIALTVTRRADDFAVMRTHLEEAVNSYSTILSPEDLKALAVPDAISEDRTITQDDRRRLRAKAVLSFARARAQELMQEHQQPSFRSPELQHLLTVAR